MSTAHIWQCHPHVAAPFFDVVLLWKKRDDTFNNTYSNISITTIQSQAFTSVNTLIRVIFFNNERKKTSNDVFFRWNQLKNYI